MQEELKHELEAVKDAAVTIAESPIVVAKIEFAALEAEIEAWWNDARQNIGALDTEVHNKLHAVKEALKARLRGIVS